MLTLLSFRMRHTTILSQQMSTMVHNMCIPSRKISITSMQRITQHIHISTWPLLNITRIRRPSTKGRLPVMIPTRGTTLHGRSTDPRMGPSVMLVYLGRELRPPPKTMPTPLELILMLLSHIPVLRTLMPMLPMSTRRLTTVRPYGGSSGTC